MPDIETRIIALLSEGEKHYTELKQVIVQKEKIRSNQTLSTWLKRLTREGKITRELKPDRTTIYKLAPDYKNMGYSSSDIVTLEKLIGQLDSVFREEALIEIEPPKRSPLSEWWRERKERIHTARRPKLRFAFYLDNATKEKIGLFLRTKEVSGELKNDINSAFKKMRENIPLALEDKLLKHWETSLTSWNDSRNFAKGLTMIHGMRGVIFAVYDGKDYADRINESLKQLNKLKNGHESDIEFLDEIARRCNTAFDVYSYLDKVSPSAESWFYEDLRDLKDIYSYLDKAFWWYCWLVDSFGRPALETSLISSAISELRRMGREIPIAELEETLPYEILDFEAYFRMKRFMLTEEDKKKVLRFTLLWAFAEVKDRRRTCKRIGDISLDEHLTKITKLASEVEDAEVKIGEEGIPEIPKLESDPILNFKFIHKGSIMDFSDEPMVINFKEYLNNPEKSQWLQRCLDLGLPLYTSLPLYALGFRVQWII